MSRVRAFGAFLYDFIVGDDPVIAVVVVVALGITAAVASGGVPAWWVMPAAVIAVLTVSVTRAAGAAPRGGPTHVERTAEPLTIEPQEH